MNATKDGIRAGGIDWAAHWIELVDARRVIIEGLAKQGPQTSFWDRRADRFARRVQAADPTNDPLTIAVLELARAADTVLDVGAGTGRYALPLAAAIAHVTAVEPASAMREQLDRALEQRQVRNVTVVPSRWEETTVERHDLVLCANVLYPIAEVVPFISKLDSHARRTCAIIMRVDQMGAMIEPLWWEIWGHGCPPEPALLDLYNLLFAMGIRANIRLAGRTEPQSYADIDDALGQVRNQLFLPADRSEHDDRIRAFLAEMLVPGEAGFAAPSSPQYALVWWDKP